jgi:hypothetical protein
MDALFWIYIISVVAFFVKEGLKDEDSTVGDHCVNN